MQSTKYSAHHRCIASYMHLTKDVLHQRYIPPKMHQNMDASHQRCCSPRPFFVIFAKKVLPIPTMGFCLSVTSLRLQRTGLDNYYCSWGENIQPTFPNNRQHSPQVSHCPSPKPSSWTGPLPPWEMETMAWTAIGDMGMLYSTPIPHICQPEYFTLKVRYHDKIASQ